VCRPGTMVQSLAWNDENNMLAALTDGKLIVFYYPNVAYIDKYLLPRTVYECDAAYVHCVGCCYRRIIDDYTHGGHQEELGNLTVFRGKSQGEWEKSKKIEGKRVFPVMCCCNCYGHRISLA